MKRLAGTQQGAGFLGGRGEKKEKNHRRLAFEISDAPRLNILSALSLPRFKKLSGIITFR